MALREARLAEKMSQRDLSRISGVPQAQISRIEAGLVDLRYSSLLALAHSLGLEIALVPRKAMPAVRSIIRGVDREIMDEPRPAYTKMQS